MKRVIFSAVLLGIILIGSVLSSISICRDTNSLTAELENIQSVYESGNTEKALALSNEMNTHWHTYEHRMSLLIHDDKLSPLNMSIARITPLISNENDELIAEMQSIYHQLERIRCTELPYWYNIL